MAKKKSKTLPKLKKDLEIVFNKYIRLRDTENGYGTCISCGSVFKFSDLDAGHFYAKQGYDGLRFNEDNVHIECQGDNRFNESHLIGYAINLKNKIGEERIEELHRLASEYKRLGYKWSRLELEEMIKEYKEKVKKF